PCRGKWCPPQEPHRLPSKRGSSPVVNSPSWTGTLTLTSGSLATQVVPERVPAQALGPGEVAAWVADEHCVDLRVRDAAGEQRRDDVVVDVREVPARGQRVELLGKPVGVAVGVMREHHPLGVPAL